MKGFYGKWELHLSEKLSYAHLIILIVSPLCASPSPESPWDGMECTEKCWCASFMDVATAEAALLKASLTMIGSGNTLGDGGDCFCIICCEWLVSNVGESSASGVPEAVGMKW